MSDKRIEILIVEDSPTQAEQLKYLLEEHGHFVNIASNGKQALDKLKEYRPSIIISDIVMPEMDGYTLCREIKSDKNLRRIPVILVTALSDPDDIIKGLESGADNFIMKPYEKKYLLKIIQQILINREFQQEQPMQMGMEIFFRDKKYFITADRLQILTLLLSTYETAVEKNLDLIKAQNELKKLNEELEERVQERTSSLLEEIAERKRVDEKLQQLNRILRAIRNINQLITQETDYALLIHNACESLLATRDYLSAWIVVLDKSGKVLSHAEAGIGKEFFPIGEKLHRSELPTCCQKALAQKEVVIINDMVSNCSDCILAPRYDPNTIIVTCRLEHADNIYGLLNVAFTAVSMTDKEEIELLEEAAADIALGISKIMAEERLKESEQKFKSIFDHAADGILIADIGNKKFLSGNPMICKMLGYSEEEIANLGLTDIHPEKDISYVSEQFEKQSHGDITLVKDLPLKRKDGSIFYADVNSFPITLAGKLYLVGIFRDITERKEAEETILSREHDLKKRVKELEDFYEMGIGRELKMIELKKEIEQLKNELAKYKKT